MRGEPLILCSQKLYHYLRSAGHSSVHRFRLPNGLNRAIAFHLRSSFEPANARTADFCSVLSHKLLLVLCIHSTRDYGEINYTKARRGKEPGFS